MFTKKLTYWSAYLPFTIVTSFETNEYFKDISVVISKSVLTLSSFIGTVFTTLLIIFPFSNCFKSVSFLILYTTGLSYLIFSVLDISKIVKVVFKYLGPVATSDFERSVFESFLGFS